MEIHGKIWKNNEEKDYDLLKREKKKDQDPKREKDHNLEVKRFGSKTKWKFIGKCGRITNHPK